MGGWSTRAEKVDGPWRINILSTFVFEEIDIRPRHQTTTQRISYVGETLVMCISRTCFEGLVPSSFFLHVFWNCPTLLQLNCLTLLQLWQVCCPQVFPFYCLQIPSWKISLPLLRFSHGKNYLSMPWMLDLRQNLKMLSSITTFFASRAGIEHLICLSESSENKSVTKALKVVTTWNQFMFSWLEVLSHNRAIMKVGKFLRPTVIIHKWMSITRITGKH